MVDEKDEGFADGHYPFYDLKKYFNSNNEFKSEKELGDYIELNISLLCEEIGINYKSHKREAQIRYTPFKRGQNVRIDFLIYDQDGSVVLLEIKKPTRTHKETNMGIAQLLDYIFLAEGMNWKIKKTYLLTTQCDENFINVVERFKLPIDLILFSKNRLAIWEKNIEGS